MRPAGCAGLGNIGDNAAMDAPQQPVSPRQRLQELLAIPEGQRTEAQWDEINELEIKLASGNRQQAPEQGARGNVPTLAGHPRSSGNPHGKKRGGFGDKSRRRR
jgi:hypothetical protein